MADAALAGSQADVSVEEMTGDQNLEKAESVVEAAAEAPATEETQA